MARCGSSRRRSRVWMPSLVVSLYLSACSTLLSPLGSMRSHVRTTAGVFLVAPARGRRSRNRSGIAQIGAVPSPARPQAPRPAPRPIRARTALLGSRPPRLRGVGVGTFLSALLRGALLPVRCRAAHNVATIALLGLEAPGGLHVNWPRHLPRLGLLQRHPSPCWAAGRRPALPEPPSAAARAPGSFGRAPALRLSATGYIEPGRCWARLAALGLGCSPFLRGAQPAGAPQNRAS